MSPTDMYAQFFQMNLYAVINKTEILLRVTEFVVMWESLVSF